MKPISDKFIKYDIIRISNESGARSKTIFYAIFDYDFTQYFVYDS